jgi:CcmD family protein
MPEKIALTYLFFAYAAAFAVLIGYVARTAVGTRRLEEEVERLRTEMQTMLDESAAADGLGRGAER